MGELLPPAGAQVGIKSSKTLAFVPCLGRDGVEGLRVAQPQEMLKTQAHHPRVCGQGDCTHMGLTGAFAHSPV